ncbi:anti-sigma factor family protein [Neorhizobium alkalisoli]|uniref:anti-sigma factor family protein n=1 Tax=Neorhizobium alkalisoli TaxID=528178 RepID=UPI000CF9D492|nr:hypothetical protein [Neorhizobium alkalisoli]
MSREYFDDETLMAFADGELDAATSSRIEKALEEDETLAERVAGFSNSRMAVASAMKPLIGEPVPAALMASVRRMAEEAERGAKVTHKSGHPHDNVVPLRSRQLRPTRAPHPPWLMPAAASILAAVAGIGGFLLGRGLTPDPAFDATIAAALDRQPSGRDVPLGSSAETLHIVSSFQDGKGGLCREYELRRRQENTVTVACRQGETWVPRLALTVPRTEDYVPASAQETIDAYLASIQAGAPLSAEQEQRLLPKRDD